ncbi:hypothetical protein FRC09_006523 [Ceratobasidium sp. 395]|nr:hypothetical protein FRC09_006523 [Ceratobasidium sp. 395]
MDPEQGVRQDFREIQDLRDIQKTRKQVRANDSQRAIITVNQRITLPVKPSELELLSHQWECSWQPAAGGIVTELVKEKVKLTDPDSEFQYSPLEGAGPSNAIKEQVRRCKLNTRNWLLAKAIFLPLNMIGL